MVLNRAYEKDGERKYVTEIRADEVNMLPYKRSKDAEHLTVAAPDEG
jgi:hypothetical protein